MALATATVTIYPYPRGVDQTQRCEILYGTIAISTGGTYPPGGFPLSWNFEQIKAIPIPGSTPSSTGSPFPLDVDVQSVGNPPSGYVYSWDNVAGNLHIFECANEISNNSGPLIEIGGQISNAIVTDIIQFRATFTRN